MYPTLVAKLSNNQDSMNGNAVRMHIFFLPNLSINTPMVKEPNGNAAVTILAEIYN